MADNLIKRLLDAGVEFTEVSQSKAEKLVRDLMREGDVRRKDAERTVNELVERGRETTERWRAQIQREVSKQMDLMSERVEELEGRLEELADRLGVSLPTTTKATKAPAKKAPAKKAPAKKATATGSSGVRKVATTRTARS